MPDISTTHRYCPMCDYSAPPDHIKTQRKHFDGHSLRCSRCAYQTETVASLRLAVRLWNERGSDFGATERRRVADA